MNINKPVTLKTQQNCQAWCYADSPTRLQIFVSPPAGTTYVVSITRRQVNAWLKHHAKP